MKLIEYERSGDGDKVAIAKDIEDALGGLFVFEGLQDGTQYKLPLYRHAAFDMFFSCIFGADYEMGFSQANESNAARLCDPLPVNSADMRPVTTVSVDTHLVSTTPLLNLHARHLLKNVDEIVSPDEPDYSPLVTDQGTARRLAELTGCLLPTEQQLEYFIRGGTQSLFCFGDSIPPDADLEKWLSWDLSQTKENFANQFGLLGLFFPEGSTSTFRENHSEEAPPQEGFTVKGGGAYFWPWQDEEWIWCLSAMRYPSTELPDGKCCFRLAYRPPGY